MDSWFDPVRFFVIRKQNNLLSCGNQLINQPNNQSLNQSIIFQHKHFFKAKYMPMKSFQMRNDNNRKIQKIWIKLNDGMGPWKETE